MRVTCSSSPRMASDQTAIGLADENGNYKLATGSQDGIQPGDYFVSCSAEEHVTNRRVK